MVCFLVENFHNEFCLRRIMLWQKREKKTHQIIIRGKAFYMCIILLMPTINLS